MVYGGMVCRPWLISFSALLFQTITIPVKLYSCTGHSDLICSHRPIIALAGDDVILPCCLEPATSASFRRVEWTRPDLNPDNVHVHQHGRLDYEGQNPSYYYRTRLFINELIHGNVSMKIFSVKISDEGKYRCFIPAIQKEAFVQLIVGSVSSPVVKMANSTFCGVVLQCESKGWYPEPEVLWLDSEGNLLSAGPTETVRGPDDLYTVSSRVTVEKRHSNNFTCRVQQKNINQTREIQIHVTDDFFMTRSCSNSSRFIITGVVGIMFILAAVFVVWKWRLEKSKTKRHQGAYDETGKRENQSESNNTEVQSVVEGETEHPDQNCTQDVVLRGRNKMRPTIAGEVMSDLGKKETKSLHDMNE